MFKMLILSSQYAKLQASEVKEMVFEEEEEWEEEDWEEEEWEEEEW